MIVESFVRKIGIILPLNALRYATLSGSSGFRLRMLLKSFRIYNVAFTTIPQSSMSAAKTPSSGVILNRWNVRNTPMNEKGIRLITVNG